jgi:hypothetical protein
MSAREPMSIVIAIDTDDYSGNFEREMCAFITGVVGDCNVGLEQTLRAEEELGSTVHEWFQDHLVHEPDDSDCCRPASIWQPPQWHSVAIFVDVVPPKEIMDVIIERAKMFAEERPDRRSWQPEQRTLKLSGVRILEPQLVERSVIRMEVVGHTETATYPI